MTAFRSTTRRRALALAGGALAAAALPAAGQAAARRAVTTFTVLQDIAQNVAGEHVAVQSITKPGAEIHGYQPTPRDIVKAQDAELVLWNGLGLERWFERFFSNVSGVRSATLSEGVTPLPIREGGYEGKPNPHAWMSPSNGLIYVENARKALASLDPANAEAYAANAAGYAAKISALDAPFRAALMAIPAEKRWLVTSEGAFSYLARDYDMKEAYLWPINADAQGTPQQVKRVIDRMRENAIPVIFSESTVSDKPARQVASEAGAKYGGVLYVDSLSEADGPVPTYLKLLEVTVSTIVRGFEA